MRRAALANRLDASKASSPERVFSTPSHVSAVKTKLVAIFHTMKREIRNCARPRFFVGIDLVKMASARRGAQPASASLYRRQLYLAGNQALPHRRPLSGPQLGGAQLRKLIEFIYQIEVGSFCRGKLFL